MNTKILKGTLLCACVLTTGAFAQSSGLIDMSESKYAGITNVPLDATKWTDGFW